MNRNQRREIMWAAISSLAILTAAILLATGPPPTVRVSTAWVLFCVGSITSGWYGVWRGRRTATNDDISAYVLNDVNDVLIAEADSWRAGNHPYKAERIERAQRYEMAAAFLRLHYADQAATEEINCD